MTKRTTLTDFANEVVTVPDFGQGPFGMVIVIRNDMDDDEWRRWNALAQVSELKRVMGNYRRTNGYKGLRDAILKFLKENSIKTKEDIEDAVD